MIIFENKGELDLRAIRTFGVSSKENPDTAIGYFGTGLKYAIAILLRSGHSVTLHTGGNAYVFGTVESEIRFDTFSIVTMNGEELGFTLDLGKDWEVWMAFRELYSNTLDEGGDIFPARARADTETRPGYTRIEVNGPEIDSLFENRHRYFLDMANRRIVAKDSCVEILERSMPGAMCQGTVFYKGIRGAVTKQVSLYDYNFRSGVSLAEDRTIKSQWDISWHIPPVITASKDKKFIAAMVTAPKGTFEHDLSFNHGMHTHNMDTFLDVVGELRETFKDNGTVNPSAVEMHKKHRKVETALPVASCKLNAIEKTQLKKAKNFCRETLGLDVDDYELIVAKDLGSMSDLGRADVSGGKMYISRQCFQEGTKRVAVAILEEYTHCKHRVHDETPAQKWVYLNQIISLGEQLAGEPL